MRTSRRHFVRAGLLATAASALGPFGVSRAFAGPYDAVRPIQPGPFQPTWESLVANYKYPDWYRDAKFGIWSHWTAQCQPEMGDWYARRMYIQGDRAYEHHVKTYGHPSKVGFMEIQNLWKADKWDPERLMQLYVAAGAKYFFAMGAHHDNMDCYDSRHHAWNTVNVGPKKDMVAIWAKHARAHGLRFGISNHNSWTPRWFAPAYGYDGEGPMQGVRYDAYQLSREDGKGKWWEGLDPQDLYAGPVAVMPSGYTTAAAVRNWYNTQTNLGRENPLQQPAFNQNWFLRVQDAIDKYKPDALYFDTNELPLEQVGMDLVTHYYNQSANANGGRVDVIVNGKHMRPEHRGSFVNDIERGTANEISPDPWQTDTCIGDWHYSREVAEQNRYKTVNQVARMLLDICSKNGNLMLNIPQRGDGSIDEHEEAFLAGMARWIKVHGEGIFGSRPWKIFGEGPSVSYVRPASAPKEAPIPYTSEDVRFMTRDDALYAYVMAPPAGGKVLIKSLATGAPHIQGARVKAVSVLGAGKARFQQTPEGLSVTLPSRAALTITVGLRIEGVPV